MSLPAYEFLARDDGYVLELAELGVTVTIDRLRRRSDELIGELVVRCDLAGALRVSDDGVLTAADFNVSSLRARQDRASWLARRAQTGELLDWAGVLEVFCLRVLEAERQGQPVTHLRDVPKPTADEFFEVLGWRVPRRHPACLFADGGSLKSYLALFTGGRLTLGGARVLYVDWETDARDHRLRLERLFGPDMPDLLYHRAERPLTVEVDGLRRQVRDHGVEYVILDSVAYACDGPPEAAEVAGRYFRALRGLKVGSLSLAHINRSETGEHKPFGSVFWSNSFRQTWFAKRDHESPDGRSVTVALFCRKSNLGPSDESLGLTVAFGETHTTITRVNLADVESFASQLPVWQRMVSALRPGPLTADELAARIEAKVDTIERKARAYPKLFTRVKGRDGQTRLALVERRAS